MTNRLPAGPYRKSVEQRFWKYVEHASRYAIVNTRRKLVVYLGDELDRRQWTALIVTWLGYGICIGLLLWAMIQEIVG